MTYGMKKKKKPERKNLTFGMAKNRWLDYMQGRGGYSRAVKMIDEIRNDYLLGDEEKWNEWKTTPITELDEKLIGFMEWKVADIDNTIGRIEALSSVKMFINYVNEKLIKTELWDSSLKKARFTILKLRNACDNEDSDEDFDEDSDEGFDEDSDEEYLFYLAVLESLH